jgi:hypothetical protein
MGRVRKALGDHFSGKTPTYYWHVDAEVVVSVAGDVTARGL